MPNKPEVDNESMFWGKVIGSIAVNHPVIILQSEGSSAEELLKPISIEEIKAEWCTVIYVWSGEQGGAKLARRALCDMKLFTFLGAENIGTIR